MNNPSILESSLTSHFFNFEIPGKSGNSPLRSELLGAEHLAELAQSLSLEFHETALGRSQALNQRLRENARFIKRARNLVAATAGQEPLTPDAEWLLDNYYVIEEVIREVKTDLPQRYLKELPVVKHGKCRGSIRVYILAAVLITHTDSHLDYSAIVSFIKNFQIRAPLSIGELWAVPIMLRVTLIENLRRLAEQMLETKHQREMAIECVHIATKAHRSVLPNNLSDAFLVSWHQEVRDLEESPSIRVDAIGDLTEVLRREHRRQATNHVTLGNCITSLRVLGAVDWNEFFEQLSYVEAILKTEQTGVYQRQDFATRDTYRRAVEQLAKASGKDEGEVARQALFHASCGTTARESHIGYYLVSTGRTRFAQHLRCHFPWVSRFKTFFTDFPYITYFGCISFLIILFMLLSLSLLIYINLSVALSILMTVLLLFPAAELAIASMNWIVTRLVSPQILPKLDFSTRLPEDFVTFIVIPSMLMEFKNIDALIERLELHYLANNDTHFRFALLTDFGDASSEKVSGDEQLVAYAVSRIRKLNIQYAGAQQQIFFLFHRRRKYNPSEDSWMGWERKRGKLEEFNRLLRGASDTSYSVIEGNITTINARYVLTLDADTVLPKDAARRLVSTSEHPLNRPVLSATGRNIVSGYSIFQPRVSFLYKTGLRSLFAKIFAGSAGIDPYSSASSDVYQDLFGTGTFTGKGLYDIEAFSATVGSAFPENRILSHDLLESTYARCALVTDIELFDDFPFRYNAYSRREHRWIRGDWQLLPWLRRIVPTSTGTLPNPISWIGRWKIFDNLRRSLTPSFVLIMLMIGWALVPEWALVWTLVALALFAIPLLIQLLDLVLNYSILIHPRTIFLRAVNDLPSTFAQVWLLLAFLPNQTFVALDAVFRSLFRQLISHKRLLEWEPAAATEARLGTGFLSFLRTMWLSPVLALVLFLVIGFTEPVALLPALSLLVLWFFSPLIAWWVSRPLTQIEQQLSTVEVRELRRVARKTWRFFETFVTNAENWLPPDNYQETPKNTIAHRTSPTNIGLLLLSTISAHDLGYLTLSTFCTRMKNSFSALIRLPRLNGHFYNWYDTLTLTPLKPEYVSTVDSGNLLGCLLAVKHGLVMKTDEIIPSSILITGLLDDFDLVTISLTPKNRDAFHNLLNRCPETLIDWAEWLETAEQLVNSITSRDDVDDFGLQSFRRQVHAVQEELLAIYPWIPTLREMRSEDLASDLYTELNLPCSLKHLSTRLDRLKLECAEHARHEMLSPLIARSIALSLLATLHELSQQSNRLANDMDFRFLYNEHRYLFSIGYNVSTHRLDSAHYDLLASEAVLTSYLAVARAVVPRKHWFHLGRLATSTGGLQGLLSWGGTMFEYLMPRLLIAPPQGTMLEVASRATVARQIEYGRETRRPWGISESGFAVLSPEGDYQYQSFGIPGLGLKRGLSKDLVVAPYATLLATMINARVAIENFVALRSSGGEGVYGFYEAIDFTPSRLNRGERYSVVASYMAHHQGMGLCAITNRLLQDIHCRRLSLEPAVRSVDLLLQERVPLEAPQLQTEELDVENTLVKRPDLETCRRLTTAETSAPRSHLLSNGQYTVMVTNAGTGYSTCRGLAITRWRSDLTRDLHGSFFYFHDRTTGRKWSGGHQPLAVTAEEYEVTFSTDKAAFSRRDGAIEIKIEVVVAPDQDAEIRRITITNRDVQSHILDITSYAEIALDDARAELAHPAFSALFVETEWLPQYESLFCWRRPRSVDHRPMHAVHLVSSTDFYSSVAEYETDRSKFLGRKRTPADPEALTRQLSGTVGAVLDPIFALRKTLRVPASGSAVITFVTGFATSREQAILLADHYHSSAATDRAFDLAWAHSRIELRHLGVSAEQSHVFQRLAGHVLFPPQSLRDLRAIRENRRGQSGLWSHGISGDLPIVAIIMTDGGGLALAKQALKAHAFWRGRGFNVDIILIADQPASYREELYQDLAALARASDSRDLIDKSGGVFVRKVPASQEDHTLILAAAQIVLSGDRGTLADQTDAIAWGQRLPAKLVPVRIAEPETRNPTTVDDLQFYNGIGGFSTDGREYVIMGSPPAPWTNVIANPLVGCLATDSGLGYTWVGNSQANRLTPWSNDAVSDTPAEVVYLRDEETGMHWSATPQPTGGPTVTRHGVGYTQYITYRHGISTEMTVFVTQADPVKIVRLRITNLKSRVRRISATYFAELILGVNRKQTASHVITELDIGSETLFARCAFNDGYSNSIAFADTNIRPRSFTGDRAEFLGRNRSVGNPVALTRTALSNRCGPGFDPCFAIMGLFQIPIEGTVEVVFVLGEAKDAHSARQFAEHYRDPVISESELRTVISSWDKRLSVLRVRTPDPALDVLVNRWLPYQVLSCRLWGRTGFYQSGGAYGFRDQLQDVAALVYAEPELAREHILRAVHQQFEEGDVQHWWHPPSGRGVRTRFSDDFLWLPYIVTRYVEVTGDAQILEENIPYLSGPLLTEGEQEHYFQPEVSERHENLYSHCLRALKYGWRLGPHHLPLMGCGDWNDGMNLVGVEGVGESVWVGWFQIDVRNRFAEVAESRHDYEMARQLRAEAEQLRVAIESHAWDGDWYLRAWFDNGSPLGSKANDECRIDSLAQTWAVLSQAGDPVRAQVAIDSAIKYLVQNDTKLVKLFEPPFDHGTLQPGYIKGYVPGIRENGGQYTHAAVWLVQALASLGRGTQALEIWKMINPLSHSSTAEAITRYKVEPYVIAADLYSLPPHIGRGGWTWYTGSAAWLYRAAVESILGFSKRGDRLSFDPRITSNWTLFEVDYLHGASLYHCRVENPNGLERGVSKVWIDDQLIPDGIIPLLDDGREHSVRIVIDS